MKSETILALPFLRVTSTDTAGESIVEGLALEGHGRLDAGGRSPLPDCTMVGVGVAAGCLDGEWCAPGRGDVLGEASCVTIGTASDSNTDDTASFSISDERSAPDKPPNGKIVHTFAGTLVDCKDDTSSPAGDHGRGDFYVGVVKDNGDGDTLILTVRLTELASASAPGTHSVGAGLPVTASFDSSAACAWSENLASGSVTVTGTAPAIRVSLDSSRFVARAAQRVH